MLAVAKDMLVTVGAAFALYALALLTLSVLAVVLRMRDR
jgi:hypothetical protein